MRPPKIRLLILLTVFLGFTCTASSTNSSKDTPPNTVLHERRQRAAAAFPDGLLLFHASSALDPTADGFRQDPFFYYFTGLANTVGALLAIDGKSRESWLFLPSKPPFLRLGLQPEVQPGPESATRLDVEHVVDWSQLEAFLTSRAAQTPPPPLYFAVDHSTFDSLPPSLLSSKTPQAPLWLQIILQRWPAFEAKESHDRIEPLLAVQSADEIAALRSAANATVPALMAGMRAIRPGVSQRIVESAVENATLDRGRPRLRLLAVGDGRRHSRISPSLHFLRAIRSS